MAESFPKHAQIVVIGGGVIGTAVAFRLAELGSQNVVVLERGQLGCGTSWHAAGNIPLLDQIPEIVKLNRLAGDLYESFEQEQPIGWQRCGRVMLARTASRMAEFRLLVDSANSADVEACLMSAQEAQEKLPQFRTDDLVGALWSPGDGRINPTDLINTYARKARSRGVQFFEHTEVKSVVVADNAVTGVATSHGVTGCEYVVNCAGLWSRPLGLQNKIGIPVYPVEHFYALTEPIDGITPDMPTFRDPDALIYGREEVGGLLIGCFDLNAKPVSPEALPDNFSFGLLNEDWEQFGPYLERGMHLVPALANTGIKALINGPESFTPDGFPILDQATEVQGYFVLTGLNSAGILRSAGLALALAQWLVHGDAGIDLSRFSLNRFRPEQNDEAWLRERVRHAPSGHFATPSG
ncbi:MAG TPA: hypothetical protein DG414_03030 [Gammaproteobacteria bacterium]|jgi:4-methylaminobutanoate oxidase (formaldehyde-forming)|nr:hypothetical protein [Gammaproteobacteria bacterium]|tara:strand:+ start:2990 stop:4219 length:1230 start_codon:yes stop_codon:yes gene_type:complete